MRRAELAGILAALALVSAPLAACGGDDDGGNGGTGAAAQEEADDSVLPVAANVTLPAGVTAEMVGEGRKLFGTTCVVCHGPDARGTQLGPSLQDGEWLQISGEYDEIVRVVQGGVPEPEEYPVPMPPEGGGRFTGEQVRALGAYVYSLGQGKARPAADTTAGDREQGTGTQ